MNYKIGQIVEIGGRIMECVPQRTRGAMYRKGAYFIYADDKKVASKLNDAQIAYYRKLGKELRKERGIINRNQPVAISDIYAEDEGLIGGRKWWLTKSVVRPIKEAKYAVGGVVQGAISGVKEAGGGIKGMIASVGIVLMLFVALIVYIIFVRGKGAEGVSVSAVGK